ncbi:VCBS repeat-containing protein [Clostridium sp.]|uniref:FG-GAP repeat domain-containing protein n=1 Tax=Clostridium sp. TaxID=1506 RepID=UPI0026183660|nr:VCBS repeat-containing protein [Clostridium sp.]
MKLTKKKYVKICILILLLFIAYPIVSEKLLTKKHTIETNGKTIVHQTVKSDLNGDGIDDTLYISLKDNIHYYMYSSLNNRDYDFKPSKKVNSLGLYSNDWPMTINLMDLDRNTIPEIIIQSSEKDTSIQHIFKWTGEEFEDLFCSTNNIFGVVDSNNGKTPKIISFTLGDSLEAVQRHMLLNKNLKNISYDNFEISGFNVVNQFIDIICLNYEISELPNIFTNYIASEDLSLIWKLDKDSFTYSFQDAFFRDISWDDKGNLKSCNWSLNFNKTNKNDPSLKTQINFNLTLENIDNTFYINSINLHSKN